MGEEWVPKRVGVLGGKFIVPCCKHSPFKEGNVEKDRILEGEPKSRKHFTVKGNT